MRAAHGTIACLGPYLLDRDVDSGGLQALDDQLVAVVAAISQPGQAVLDRSLAGLDPKGDQMHPAFGPLERQLHARYEADSDLARGVPGLADPVEGVVVGQCDGAQTFLGSPGGPVWTGCPTRRMQCCGYAGRPASPQRTDGRRRIRCGSAAQVDALDVDRLEREALFHSVGLAPCRDRRDPVEGVETVHELPDHVEPRPKA